MKFSTILRSMIAVVATLFATAVSAQKVDWTTNVTPAGEKEWLVEITASIQDGWHIYDIDPEFGGYTHTTITFTTPKGVELVGELTPSVAAPRHTDEWGDTIGYWEDEVTFSQTIKCSKKRGATVPVLVEWQACCQGQCATPEELELQVVLGEGAAVAAPAEEQVAPAEDGNANGNLWAMILEAIIWGFAALLTPCVFPMVPMTVSFFMKGSQDKSRAKFRAAMYGVFIVLLYTLPIAVIIMATKWIGGDAVTADIFNWLATHWLPNILFFLIFMVFAMSFFGAFEIVLPSKLVNKSDENVDKKKGLGGVFFLALTLVLVSFSCTGPIVGSVLIKSTQGEFWAPILTMLAFSITFSIPFVLCAFFPSLLSKMPKSGGWLNTVKVVLGFVEIALGLKFLSTADQVYHWGLLDREIYLAIWIVVFTLLGFYLLGKLHFKHDSEMKYIPTGRLLLAIGVFSFVVYMLPGMWGAPLKGLSGYLPPMQSQDFVLGANTSAGVVSQVSDNNAPTSVKYGDFLELPLGLNGFFDLKEAQAYADKVGKPIFLDFTGHGCVNCREMEARVWSNPAVLERLQNDYVICALYVDDKTKVAKEDWVIGANGKELKTLGKINSAFALEQFGANAQPHYVILGKGGEQLGDARGYNLDAEAFVEWMDNNAALY